MNIRKSRDGEKFNREKYEERDRLEVAILAEHGHYFKNVIVNKWGQLDETVESVARLLLDFIESGK